MFNTCTHWLALGVLSIGHLVVGTHSLGNKSDFVSRKGLKVPYTHNFKLKYVFKGVEHLI